MCRCHKITSHQKKKTPLEYPLNFLLDVAFCLPCEAASILEIYDQKIIIKQLDVKVLGTKAILNGLVEITIYYFSVDNQMHRVVFKQSFVEGIDLGFYYQGTPQVKILNLYGDFSLADEVKTKCESLGYRKILGQIVIKGKMRTPKSEW